MHACMVAKWWVFGIYEKYMLVDNKSKRILFVLLLLLFIVIVAKTKMRKYTHHHYAGSISVTTFSTGNSKYVVERNQPMNPK